MLISRDTPAFRGSAPTIATVPIMSMTAEQEFQLYQYDDQAQQLKADYWWRCSRHEGFRNCAFSMIGRICYEHGGTYALARFGVTTREAAQVPLSILSMFIP
jgi:hypothetical protein